MIVEHRSNLFNYFQLNEGRMCLSRLSEQYNFVSTKSNSLHSACQDLMSEQEELTELSSSVNQRLSYFIEADAIIEKLGLPSFSIHSESFAHALDKIDSCIIFLHNKVIIERLIKFKFLGHNNLLVHFLTKWS